MDRREFLQASAAALLAPRGSVQGDRPKKSLLLSMLPKELSLEERFALGKKVGFEGIEVAPTFDPAEQAALAQASKKSGLPIHSIIYGGHGKSLSDPSPQKRDEAVEDLKQGLRCARAVGADNLLLIPARVSAKVRYIEAYERSQPEIRKAVPLAEELKVVIAIEEVWNDFLLSPLEFCRYVDEFQSPWVKAYFDVGNIVKNGWPEDWIRTLGKRISRVHLKDFKRKEHKFVNLREGDVNWKEVRKALAEVGFTSYMTTELEAGNEQYLRDVSARVDKIIAGE